MNPFPFNGKGCPEDYQQIADNLLTNKTPQREATKN